MVREAISPISGFILFRKFHRRPAFLNSLHFYIYHPDVSLQNAIAIKSYSYTNLLIGYGSNKEVTVSIFWCTKSKEYKMIFNGGKTAINAHTIMREQLQAHLNQHHNLSQIVQIIADSYQPLSSLANLPIIPQLGIPVSYLTVCRFKPHPRHLHTITNSPFLFRFHSIAPDDSSLDILSITTITHINSHIVPIHILSGGTILWRRTSFDSGRCL